VLTLLTQAFGVRGWGGDLLIAPQLTAGHYDAKGRATVELLHDLVRHVPNTRLLAVATVRAEEGAGVLDSLRSMARHRDGARARLVGPLATGRLAGRRRSRDRREPSGVLAGRLFVVETLRARRPGPPIRLAGGGRVARPAVTSWSRRRCGRSACSALV
jgi:hypothetical protein